MFEPEKLPIVLLDTAVHKDPGFAGGIVGWLDQQGCGFEFVATHPRLGTTANKDAVLEFLRTDPQATVSPGYVLMTTDPLFALEKRLPGLILVAPEFSGRIYTHAAKTTRILPYLLRSIADRKDAFLDLTSEKATLIKYKDAHMLFRGGGTRTRRPFVHPLSNRGSASNEHKP